MVCGLNTGMTINKSKMSIENSPGEIMKDKQRVKNCRDNEKIDADVKGEMPAGETPDKKRLSDYSDREKKTWCSYMERGFRESRDTMNRKEMIDQSQDKSESG